MIWLFLNLWDAWGSTQNLLCQWGFLFPYWNAHLNILVRSIQMPITSDPTIPARIRVRPILPAFSSWPWEGRNQLTEITGPQTLISSSFISSFSVLHNRTKVQARTEKVKSRSVSVNYTHTRRDGGTYRIISDDYPIQLGGNTVEGAGIYPCGW